MKTARNIIVKTCLTADEFVLLTNDCEKEEVSQSKKLRDSWLSCRNGKPASRASNRPSIGQRLAKFAPSRTMRPTAYMRS
ncbi:hypothetical protein AB595_04840 [Massilia sp. WF1]|uniref:hypothetical protein n=1 Tax=unclassified Massilia TaxID=2609279 RepID=UPI000649BFF0|nr:MULTISPECIES: hypothetical protein [unclassified Massilia]ALK96996.1 hypothetical protein AM586_12755 [Massilia sp. WG5]KLU37945.1 hypothetical protein AB595_04840 [Massilia sp. WF1]